MAMESGLQDGGNAARQRARALLQHIAQADDPARPRLVVFGFGSYGDVLQITPLLRQLRTRFATAQLVLIHAHGAARSLLAGTGLADEVHEAPPACHPELLAGFADGTASADLLVFCRYVIEYRLPHNSRLSADEKDFVAAAQTIQRDWLPLSVQFPLNNDQLWRAASAQGLNMYRLMARTAGFDAADFEALELRLDPQDGVLRRELPERYWVVCNSAEALSVTRSAWTKTLPADKLERIVRKLKRSGVPSVLLGASRDDAPVAGVDFDWRGRSSLRQAAAILRDAALFIAPEGGIANLARAVGRNGIVFFGSTPAPFFAFSTNTNIQPQICGGCWWTTPSYLYQCPRLLRTPACVQSLPEDAIVQAARRMLT